VTALAYEHLLAVVGFELAEALEKFPAFNSAHEGYAVILEELDELWDAVKENDIDHARKEAVQVAAMAVRFLVDIKAVT
jgi:hypothetical protein